ncbi:MAG: cytochrome-c peroxidase [Gammaproteobacteria bacterium]
MHFIKCVLTCVILVVPTTAITDNTIDSIEGIGRALFFDTNLSINRTQACVTCHSPQHAFVDPRSNASGRAVSLGFDGKLLGDRNTPTLTYAEFSPKFSLNDDLIYVGGQFLDGRSIDLSAQAQEPFLNPIEMGMPSKSSVVERIQENPIYVASFKHHFGRDVFDSTDQAYRAMADSIATFEESELFSPFDSKYDRYLRGQYKMTDLEELGMTLFFSQQFTNCHNCHQLKPSPNREGETFSNYQYHNIAVPANKAARAVNGVAPDFIDNGLLQHPDVDSQHQAGKFKVPTLRNVAVTAPYMHNGVFEDLRTVMLFYNKFNSNSSKRQINPETGEQWQPPEVSKNISLSELEKGPALEDRRIDALVAFMKTLTDKRYEHMLEE